MKHNNKKGKRDQKKREGGCGEFIWDTHDGAAICGLPSEYILCRRAMTGELCGVHATMSSTICMDVYDVIIIVMCLGGRCRGGAKSKIDMVMI